LLERNPVDRAWLLLVLAAAACSSSSAPAVDAAVPHGHDATVPSHDARSDGHDAPRVDHASPPRDAGKDAGHDAAPADVFVAPSPDAGCHPECPSGFTCCGGECVNEQNDFRHCGACGRACDGGRPYCHEGICGVPACEAGACDAGEQCCGAQCCAPGALCCDLPSPLYVVPTCAAAVNGACPGGCPLCP
jgi:hypothetical protein